MEFFKNPFTIVEVYPQGEQPSNEDVINEKSQWVQVSTELIEENPDLLKTDLDTFIAKITTLYDGFYENVSTFIKTECENPEDVISEFNKCVNFSTNMYDVLKLSKFTEKNPQIKTQTTLISKMLNIISIKCFVNVNIPNTMGYTFAVLEIKSE